MLIAGAAPLSRSSLTVDMKNRCLQWRCLLVRTLVFYSVAKAAAVVRHHRMPMPGLWYKEIPLSPHLLSAVTEDWGGGGSPYHTVLRPARRQRYESECSRKENCHSSNPPISSVYGTRAYFKSRTGSFFAVQLASRTEVPRRDLAYSCLR